MNKPIPVGNGPGKYEAEVARAREETDAQLCLLIVQNGNRGSGFAVHATDWTLLAGIPDVLENVARQIRAQQRGQQ